MLGERIGAALDLLAAAAADACGDASDKLALRFISPLADGADQLAASIALERGWKLQAVLPFERTLYRDALKATKLVVCSTPRLSALIAFWSYPAASKIRSRAM